MRPAAALILLLSLGAASGCTVVVATAGAVGLVAATSVKTAGKVTATTVKTTGRVATAALSSGGEVSALTLESAARLARTGMVVLVDVQSGAVTELPWREGLQLSAAVQAGHPGAQFARAVVFRSGRRLTADLAAVHSQSPRLGLQSRDVIELQR